VGEGDTLETNRGSIRQEVRISRPASRVWELVGDPARVQEWFPTIESSAVDGLHRMITLASGQVIDEDIVTLDPLQRRFQYEMHAPLCRTHLGTLDVVAIDDESCLVIYGTDAEPATMALTISGAVGAALEKLRAILERVA
jgi:hypothetical protein